MLYKSEEAWTRWKNVKRWHVISLWKAGMGPFAFITLTKQSAEAKLAQREHSELICSQSVLVYMGVVKICRCQLLVLFPFKSMLQQQQLP